MQQGAENETTRNNGPGTTIVSGNHIGGKTSGHQNGNERSADVQSVPQVVVGFIERNPVVAAGAALAAGVAVAMLVQSRKSSSNRIDRRVQRAVRSMDKSFTREMRALRHSDLADQVGRYGSSLGDVVSRIDLGPIAERGRVYLDAARRRLGV